MAFAGHHRNPLVTCPGHLVRPLTKETSLHILTRLGIAGAIAVIAVPASSGAAFAVTAAPSTAYVSPSGAPGNSGGDCSEATFTSVQAAVDAVAEGGTVVVCAGT